MTDRKAAYRSGIWRGSSPRGPFLHLSAIHPLDDVAPSTLEGTENLFRCGEGLREAVKKHRHLRL